MKNTSSLLNATFTQNSIFDKLNETSQYLLESVFCELRDDSPRSPGSGSWTLICWQKGPLRRQKNKNVCLTLKGPVREPSHVQQTGGFIFLTFQSLKPHFLCFLLCFWHRCQRDGGCSPSQFFHFCIFVSEWISTDEPISIPGPGHDRVIALRSIPTDRRRWAACCYSGRRSENLCNVTVRKVNSGRSRSVV